ncbi:hypothetical protein L798_03159 [Zootermopsis nevadensis]|uniref:Uncharacterized protein n=1 Tax=Zootermopsis nevadensis TaxID=136037 RepID=A0A067REB6_ZOONE|nr:hypothetical protein L798_03159 [Zootermopsis nevadensis]
MKGQSVKCAVEITPRTRMGNQRFLFIVPSAHLAVIQAVWTLPWTWFRISNVMIGSAQTARPAYNVKIQLMRTKCCSVICVTEGIIYTVSDCVEFQVVDGIVRSVQFAVHVEHKSQQGTVQTHPMLSGSTSTRKEKKEHVYMLRLSASLAQSCGVKVATVSCVGVAMETNLMRKMGLSTAVSATNGCTQNAVVQLEVVKWIEHQISYVRFVRRKDKRGVLLSR